jgi:histone-lysine N-methyltransferase SETD3
MRFVPVSSPKNCLKLAVPLCAALYLTFVAILQNGVNFQQTFKHHHQRKNIDAVYSDLLHWMVQNGAFVSPALQIVKYNSTSDFRGLHAIENISKGEVIISLPNDMILTPELALTSSIVRDAQASLGNYSGYEYTYLALFLCDQRRRGPTASFSPYIDALPIDLSNMPVFFSHEEISYLSGTDLGKSILTDIENINMEYYRICSIKGLCGDIKSGKTSFSGITLDDFHWAYQLASSRVFSIDIAGRSLLAMMPYSDLLNHDADADAHWQYNETTQTANIITKKIIPKGKAVTVTYGNKDNARLLRHYGFTVPGNNQTNFMFPLSLPENQNRVVSTGKTIRFRLDSQSESYDFFPFMYIARIIVDTEVQGSRSVNWNATVSMKNEESALTYALNIVDAQLKKYPTTVEEDVRLLSSDKLSRNIRNIIEARRSEKESFLRFQITLNMLLALTRAKSLDDFNQLRYKSDYKFVNTGYPTYLEGLLNKFKSY